VQVARLALSSLVKQRIEGNVLAFPIIVYVLASWLIAAHFLRADDLALVALCLAAPVLFFVRERWSVLLLQCLAYLACVIWLFTAWQIVSQRLAFDQPWRLSAAILLTVAAVSMVAGLLLRSRTVLARYRGR
jgi:hypothetical protein